MPTTAAIGIRINKAQLDDLNHLMKSMGERAAKRALSRSINRTLGVQSGGMRKTLADEIRRDVNLTRTYLYKQRSTRRGTVNTFSIHRATVNKPTGSISTHGPNIPTIQYSNQRGLRKRYAQKIYVKVQKSRGRKLLAHAFIPQLKTGHRGIFVRKNPGAKGKEGRKIKELFSSRVPDVLINAPTMSRVLKIGSDRFERELTHQIDYILKYNK